jgi:hypothetical protein
VENDGRSGHPQYHRTIERVEKVWNVVHSDGHSSIKTVAVQLNLDKETIMCVEKAWTLAQQLDYWWWQCSSSWGVLGQAVSGPKINYWNRIPTLFPWFGSEWLLAVSKNKICLKGIKISAYWRHPKKYYNGTESCSTAVFPTVAASLG